MALQTRELAVSFCDWLPACNPNVQGLLDVGELCCAALEAQGITFVWDHTHTSKCVGHHTSCSVCERELSTAAPARVLVTLRDADMAYLRRLREGRSLSLRDEVAYLQRATQMARGMGRLRSGDTTTTACHPIGYWESRSRGGPDAGVARQRPSIPLASGA